MTTTREQRQRVINEARSWLGTPYHHMGRVKGAGVDCATLLAEVYAEVGLIPAVTLDYYPPDWHLHRDHERYLEGLLRYAQPTSQPLPGDIAVFRFGRTFSHGAILLDSEGQLIHAYIRRGVVLGHLAEAALSGRPVQFFTLWSD